MKLVSFTSACVVAALWVLSQRSAQLAPPGLLALWLVACIVGEAFWTNVPGGEGTISMALALDIAALTVLGNRGGVEVIALSTLLAGICPHRRQWYKILFNAAQSTLSAGAALVLARLYHEGSPPVLVPDFLWWPGLLLTGLAFFSVNTALVACAISLSSDRPLWRAWRDNFGYSFELASSLAQVTLAGFLLLAYGQVGPVTLLFVLPIIAVLGWSSAREARVRLRLIAPQPVSHTDSLRPTG
jgi:hypothetical protein